MTSHLQDFAHHLVERHGTISVGSVWTHFVDRLGNSVPGSTPDEQQAHIAGELSKDDRLVVTAGDGSAAVVGLAQEK